MKPVLFALLCLFVSAVGARAEIVELRSGEHGGFTRLVVSLPTGARWRVDTTETGLSLMLDGPVTGFDTASVFRRIGRQRLSDLVLRPDETVLDIALACKCGFRSFMDGASFLVLDIGEEITSQGSAGTPGFTSEGGELEGGRSQRAEQADAGSGPQGQAVLPLIVPRPAPARVLDLVPEADAQTIVSDDARRIPHIVETMENLRDEIGRATTQGRLTAAEPRPATSMQLPEIETDIGDPDLNEASADKPSSPLDNLRTIRAAVGQVGAAPDRFLSGAGRACLTRDDLNIASWGHDIGFAAGLGEWRLRLTQEFDRVDPEAALGLARHYLHYGFGAEALSVLDLLPMQESTAPVLIMMARIMDGDSDGRSESFSDMLECDGPAALWAALSGEGIPRAAPLNRPALRLAFEELPAHLKPHLGPKLAARLAEAGETDTAEAILASLERGAQAGSPATDLARARLSLAKGEPESAVEPLSTVVQSNSALSPAALIAMIDTAVAANQPIGDETVKLVASYVFEHRRSPSVADLERVHTLALAHSGQFSEAFARLSGGAATVPSGGRIVSQIMARLVDHAPDIVFLAETVRPPSAGLTVEVGNRTAGRLLSLGFAEMATAFLTDAAEGEQGRIRRLLRAQAALALNQPVAAEAELLGLTGEDVDLLRAEARRRSGDYTAALRGLSGPELADWRRDTAWLAGDWPTLATTDDDTIARAARLMMRSDTLDTDASGQSDTEPASEGVLRQIRDLISDSGETRAVLLDLLTRFEVEELPAQ